MVVRLLRKQNGINNQLIQEVIYFNSRQLYQRRVLFFKINFSGKHLKDSESSTDFDKFIHLANVCLYKRNNLKNKWPKSQLSQLTPKLTPKFARPNITAYHFLGRELISLYIRCYNVRLPFVPI